MHEAAKLSLENRKRINFFIVSLTMRYNATYSRLQICIRLLQTSKVHLLTPDFKASKNFKCWRKISLPIFRLHYLLLPPLLLPLLLPLPLPIPLPLLLIPLSLPFNATPNPTALFVYCFWRVDVQAESRSCRECNQALVTLRIHREMTTGKEVRPRCTQQGHI